MRRTRQVVLGYALALRPVPATGSGWQRLLRRLWQFNQRLQVRYGDDANPSELDDRSYVFLQRDFITAYKNYSIHQAMLPELVEKGLCALPEPVRLFLRDQKHLDKKRALTEPKATLANQASNDKTTLKARPIPDLVTGVRLRDRRNMLRQQAALCAAKASYHKRTA